MVYFNTDKGNEKFIKQNFICKLLKIHCIRFATTPCAISYR